MALRVPNGPEGFNTTFKDLGSLIAIYEEITAGNTGIQNKLVAAVEQLGYDYGTVKILPTLTNNVVSTSSNLDTGKANVVSAVGTYLTTVTATDIASTSTTASGVVADLISIMVGATSGVATISGLRVVLSGHFYNYFWDEYSIVMPNVSGALFLSDADSVAMISGFKPSGVRQVPETYGD